MAEGSRPKRLDRMGSVAALVAAMTASIPGRAAPPGQDEGGSGPSLPEMEDLDSAMEEVDSDMEVTPSQEYGPDEEGSDDDAEPNEAEETESKRVPQPKPDPEAPNTTSAAEEQEGGSDAARVSADAASEERKAQPQEIPPEEENGWLSWPFTSSEAEGAPAQRWATIGGFVGWVHRPSRSDAIDYRPGLAYGGFIRPELTSWLGLRLFYREERLPVKMDPGAYEVDGEELDLEFTQPDLEIMNLGGRLEPTWVIHPRLRVHGIIGYAWLQMRAPSPQADGFEVKKTFRTAAQTELTLGAGFSVDIIQDWLGIGVDVGHSIPTTRWGDAYDHHQVIVDGEIRHLNPLPKLRSGTDVLVSVGLIL